MKKYSVSVTVTYDFDYVISAKDEDDAQYIAEQLAIDECKKDTSFPSAVDAWDIQKISSKIK